jgi:pyruvate formate lyase activating enzyme
MTSHGLCRDRKKCQVCVACVEVCPAKAQEVKGVEWDLDALIKEVLKDRAFFGEEGGITCSGGEALLQGPFVEMFLARLKQEGIHTALDTAAAVPTETLERVLPFTDLLLLDLKLFDEAEHKKYTGISNKRILANARHLAGRVIETNRPEFWIRTPIIPNATDTQENLAAIGHFIANDLQNTPAKWELCSFNNLCVDKYARLGEEWSYAGTQLLSRKEMEQVYSIARNSGVKPGLVVWSGGTRAED